MRLNVVNQLCELAEQARLNPKKITEHESARVPEQIAMEIAYLKAGIERLEEASNIYAKADIDEFCEP